MCMFEALNTFNAYLYNVTIAVVIVLIGLIVGILIRKLISKILREIDFNRKVEKLGVNWDAESFTGTLLSLIVYVITIVILLDYWNIRYIAIILVVAVLLILVLLGLLIDLRDLPRNLSGRWALRSNKEVRVGKKISINNISGTVERIRLMETIIKTSSGDRLYLPNQLFRK